jgi:hypothetical protein
MHDYFNYFTEIEEHFCRRRGSVVLCSTLDWALMETWKNAGVPLEAVLRGIDVAFDHYEARPKKTRKINSLAWCAQAVLHASEEMQEAAVGAHRAAPPPSGLEPASLAAFFERNAAEMEKLPGLPPSAGAVVRDACRVLRDLATGAGAVASPPLEDLERRLTVLEDKILAALLAATADDELVALRAEADRELAPYRRKMLAAQIEQLHKQYVNKRLLERFGVPRLSLFYL